jgi:hypothetical protein
MPAKKAAKHKPQDDFSDVLSSITTGDVDTEKDVSPIPDLEVAQKPEVVQVDQELRNKGARAIKLLIEKLVEFSKPRKTRYPHEVLASAQELINKAKVIAAKLKGE